MNSFIKKISFYRRKYRQFGLRAVLFLLISRLKPNRVSNIRIRNVKHPVFLSNFDSDVTTLFQIFFLKEYDIQLKSKPAFIIDCGANIGLSTVFFAGRYPEARIIAIEPDRNNFKYLELNTSSYSNVTCLNKAIWSNSKNLKIVDPGVGNWGYQTIEADLDERKTIEGISLDMILEDFSIDKIDLLKIDIEGAEKELFSKNFKNWLGKTKLIAIELHDNVDPNTSNSFFETIKSFPCNKYYIGENLICDFEI